MSYLVHLKTMFVDGLKQTFDKTYPAADWRDIHVSIEYPIREMDYPGIWVDYDDTDPLQISGVDHTEFILDDQGRPVPVSRWKFAGYISMTVTALTSLERDRLYDELVSVIAFGRNPETPRGRFRAYVDTNDFIATTMQYDQIQPRGNVSAPGTPWGTDEMIYERTINLEIIGEFVPTLDDTEPGLLRLSEIIVHQDVDLTPETPFEPVDEPGADGTKAWH